jgi:hypothetical protein
MKTRLSLFLFLCGIISVPIFLDTSCSKAKELAAFDVTYNFPKVSFSYSVKSLKPPELTLYTGEFSINMDSILSANHIPSGIISSAHLSKLAMVITAPPGATFNWLQSVRMQGSADSTFQQPTDLGSQDNIVPTSTTVELVLQPVDIKPILFRNAYWLRILATPSGTLPGSSVSMYLDSQVKIHIEPL